MRKDTAVSLLPFLQNVYPNGHGFNHTLKAGFKVWFLLKKWGELVGNATSCRVQTSIPSKMSGMILS